MFYLRYEFIVGNFPLALVRHIAPHESRDGKGNKGRDQHDEKLVFGEFAVISLISVLTALRLIVILLVIHKRSFLLFFAFMNHYNGSFPINQE